ncbi:hypothetical protein MP228_007561 [Amoeboaphelidium protococcarum]|nr:hypothetical protein MP228_007561 [Amoeboaphelidium protococcarum]
MTGSTSVESPVSYHKHNTHHHHHHTHHFHEYHGHYHNQHHHPIVQFNLAKNHVIVLPSKKSLKKSCRGHGEGVNDDGYKRQESYASNSTSSSQSSSFLSTSSVDSFGGSQSDSGESASSFGARLHSILKSRDNPHADVERDNIAKRITINVRRGEVELRQHENLLDSPLSSDEEELITDFNQILHLKPKKNKNKNNSNTQKRQQQK